MSRYLIYYAESDIMNKTSDGWMKGSPPAVGGSLMSKPTRPPTSWCAAAPAFFVSGGAGEPNDRK
jgi:hypothetical protein